MQSASRTLVRSCLFTPADRMPALVKGLNMRALDVMVIDMEDACSSTEEAKARARENVHTFLSNLQSDQTPAVHPSIVVRINCPQTTKWGKDDLAAILDTNKGDAILLPKAEDLAFIKDIGQQLPARLPLWTMIETPRGVQRVDNIAELDKVECLVFGSNDLSKDLHAPLTPDRQPILYSMSKTVLAARASQKLAVDGVHMDLSDGFEAPLLAVCHQGKNLGFDGKSLIHPKQVAVTNSVFSPSEADIEHASRVIDTYQKEAINKGKGVALLDGKLIEELHFTAAKQLLVHHAQILKNV